MAMKKIENSVFDPFVKWFFPKLLPAVPRGITANMVSTAGIVISFLAGLAMALSGYFDPAIAPAVFSMGGVLLLATWITDTMDGVIARSRNQVSVLGHYLDHFGDSLTVAFIGIGMYLSPGSHLVIGVLCAVIYLLFHVDAHIKVKILDELTLPVIGPTELRFIIVTVIFVQRFVDFGKPLSWLPGITGNDGWLTGLLGFSRGLTFIDVAGLLAILFGSIGLIVQTAGTIRRLGRMDAERRP